MIADTHGCTIGKNEVTNITSIDIPITYEQAYKNIEKHCPFYILFIDKDFKIVFLNRSAYSDPEEWIGNCIDETIVEEEKKQHIDLFTRGFEDQKPRMYKTKTIDGKTYNAQMIPCGDVIMIIAWDCVCYSESKLSRREMEIKALVDSGFSSKQISDHLNISIQTVHAHRKRINFKTR